ncbi:MAG: NAD(+)/NADH kinase [Muribaculaceae bacterium]|nr:NAD(+)/NADH kinase [Muribaculaceae bacterium]MDE6793750.1 NAD(+)/NADH kinase [Muribaculaceae bacterium]
MNNRIAIYGSRRQDSYLEELAGLFYFMHKIGFEVTVHPKLYNYLRSRHVDMQGATCTNWVAEDTALVISIGGDGTFLRAARWVGRREIPILGINTGHLGFLASCGIGEACEMLEAICRGDVIVERRMLLEVQSRDLPDNAWPFALNDVSLLKEECASMITVRARVDGHFLADYRADGFVVSTPTGSTAYNLSAGGPILEPTIDCISLVAVAPHTLTVRPLVVGGDSEIELTIESRTDEFRLSLDGESYPLPAGEKIWIRRADFSTLLVRRKDSNFATILRDKLNWNI